MKESILFQNKKLTIWVDGADLTFENNSNGESYTLYCELDICTVTDRITDVKVYDYDGCFDFNRDEVVSALKEYNPFIKIDFSEL